MRLLGIRRLRERTRLSASSHQNFPDWLKSNSCRIAGNADLVAHFFRRAFSLLRPDGAFGLIATKTIGTRRHTAVGLDVDLLNRGSIFAARRRFRWPGQAAVVVSVVHVSKNCLAADSIPRRKQTDWINHRTFWRKGMDEKPIPLTANANNSVQRWRRYGTWGFTFCETPSLKNERVGRGGC